MGGGDGVFGHSVGVVMGALDTPIGLRRLPREGGIGFVPGLVGTFQDSDGGDGRHCSPPPSNGNSSWRGSSFAWDRLRCWRVSERRCERPADTRRRIGEPLAFYAEKGAISAGQIIDAKGDAVVIA